MPASMPMAIRRWTGPASLAAAGIRTDTTSALVQGERLLSRRRLQWDPPALQQARPRHRDGDRPEQRLKVAGPRRRRRSGGGRDVAQARFDALRARGLIRPRAPAL